MGFYWKAILVILILSMFFCKSIIRMDKIPFEFKVNKLELWLDLMPKVESGSRLHLEIDFNLFNLTKEKIEIDSINFEINVDNNYSHKFYDLNNVNEIILHDRFEHFYFKSSIRNQFKLNNNDNRLAQIFANVYFKIRGKNFAKNILIGEQEIQLVY